MLDKIPKFDKLRLDLEKNREESMHLPKERNALLRLNLFELLDAIVDRRMVIRGHRDAKGDHRCWLDDFPVWNMLQENLDGRYALPPYDAMMKQCRDFYENRNAPKADLISLDAIIDRAHWDDDLKRMYRIHLIDELVRIQEAIHRHIEIGDRSRTANDDRKLYAVLPEKVQADFRLPSREDFLGEGKAPTAGCPSFWRSHTNNGCQGVGHDLHNWGPCKVE